MKTNIKKISRYWLIVILALFTSCNEDFLDNENKSTLDDKSQWTTESNADIYLNDIYGNLWTLNNTPDQLDGFTDDNDPGIYWASWRWKQGIVTPSQGNVMDTPWFDWNSSTYATWSRAYERIRKCNLFIKKINEHAPNFSEGWIKKRMDEVKFLRAFTYAHLFMHFGGVPILTVTLNRNTQTEDEILNSRNTFEETFNFITNDLQQIVSNNVLPAKYNLADNEAGRATLGAALALKGWIELYAASPAFNSATPAAANGTGATSEQMKLTGFGNFDEQRWAKAAATNKQFIDTYEGTYQLFPDLGKLWTESNEYNSEVIFDRQHVKVMIGSIFEVFGGPVFVNGNYYTWGNYCPTQELVDNFGMANGKAITDPGSGYDPQKPYVNREKRFYDFIVYDGAPYKQNWMTKADTIYTRIHAIEAKRSKNQIDFATDDVTNTGYYFKKRLNQDNSPGWGQSGLNYVFIRYAEVLLNYAEAQNEANGPDASVYSAVNKVRIRSNVPTLESTYGGQVLSKDEMREAIRRERRVELCFENKRFYDIIRWNIAHQIMNKDLHGMKITNTVNNLNVWNYEVIGINHPHVFHQRMYLNPVPQDVIDRNPKVIQNPGY